jgi:hypothetical protein
MSQQESQSTMQTVQDTFEFPMDQAVRMQRTFAELVLNSLTMGDWLQSRGVELTKQGFDNYIQTLEATSQQMGRAGQQATSANGQSLQRQQIPQQAPQPQQIQQQPRTQQFQTPQPQRIQPTQQYQQQPRPRRQEPQAQPPQEDPGHQEQVPEPQQ